MGGRYQSKTQLFRIRIFVLKDYVFKLTATGFS